MFSPPGYVPLAIILKDALSDSLFEQAEEYLVKHTKSISFLYLHRRDDLVLRWVIQHCGNRLFACNVSNGLVRVSHTHIFRSRFYVDLVQQEEKIIFPEEIKNDFRFCDLLRDEDVDAFNELVEAYNQCEESERPNLEVKLKASIEKAATGDGLTRPPLFFTIEDCRIDLRFFKHLVENDLLRHVQDERHELTLIARSLENIDGWYLVVPEDLYGDSWQEFCKDRSTRYAAEREDLEQGNLGEPSVGRPRKRDRAAAAFNEIFPSGLGHGDTWKKASRQVESAIGEQVSIDTLRRGLGFKE